jgi:Flp pilus assembly pilin Flp
MGNVVKRLWQDERGFVVSAELVLVVTVGVLAMIVGISSVASAINNELNDVGNAFGALDQSYWFTGLVKFGHSGVPGSAFVDRQDFCDCSTIVRTVPRAHAPVPFLAPAVPPVLPCPVPCPPGVDPVLPHPPIPAPKLHKRPPLKKLGKKGLKFQSKP